MTRNERALLRPHEQEIGGLWTRPATTGRTARTTATRAWKRMSRWARAGSRQRATVASGRQSCSRRDVGHDRAVGLALSRTREGRTRPATKDTAATVPANAPSTRCGSGSEGGEQARDGAHPGRHEQEALRPRSGKPRDGKARPPSDEQQDAEGGRENGARPLPVEGAPRNRGEEASDEQRDARDRAAAGSSRSFRATGSGGTRASRAQAMRSRVPSRPASSLPGPERRPGAGTTTRARPRRSRSARRTRTAGPRRRPRPRSAAGSREGRSSASGSGPRRR